MKIEKRNGSWRFRKTINGKTHSFTINQKNKPTQKQIDELIEEFKHSRITQLNAPKQSFEDCANKYLEVKGNILSASTLRAYRSILKTLDDDFKNMLLSEIDQLTLQQLINDISKDKSPKTVKNYYAFISSIIKMFIQNPNYNITLPQKQKVETYIPTSDEVKAVLQASNDKYKIIFMLACYGLRRSEILALELDDIDGNIVHITKAKVYDGENYIIQNFNKTTESRRDVPISQELADMIKEQGYVFKGHPRKILEYLNRKQDQLKINRFKFHAFRHYFATELNQAGMSSKDIQKLGGWSSSHIMTTVYQHARIDKDKAMQEKAVKIIDQKLTK